MPNEPRVLELRVHGVGGPTPEYVLETAAPRRLPSASDESAGFYTRDAPGPDGQSVEAFVWGGLTSRTKTQAAWWLLLPFSLVNLAGWMLRGGPGADGGHEARWSAVWWIRMLLTVGGVVLTLAYVMWAAVALLDVVAYQCGAIPDCVGRSWLLPFRWLDGDPLWRLTLGVLAVFTILFAILLSAKLTNTRYEEYEPDAVRRRHYERGRGRLRRNDNLKHPGFWFNRTEWRRLFNWHAYTSLAVVGALFGYSVAASGAAENLGGRSSSGAAIVWTVIVGIAIVGAAALVVRPIDKYANDDAVPKKEVRAKWALAVVAVVGVISGGALSGWAWQAATGSGIGAAEGGLGLMTGLFVLVFVEGGMLMVGIVPVVANFWAFTRLRRSGSITPRLEDGWRFLAPAGAVTAGFAIANAGFGAMVVRLVDYLDGGEAADIAIGVVSAGVNVDVFLIAAVVAGLALIVPLLWHLRPGNKHVAQVDSEYDIEPEPGEPSVRIRTRVARKAARARVASQIGRNIDRLFTTLMVVIVLVSFFIVVRLTQAPMADVTSPLVGLGTGSELAERLRTVASWVLVLYIFPGAWIVRSGARSRGTRRQVGKVWDSITFFPRRFHPLGAPCYAEKAVPMLREHIRHKTHDGWTVVIRSHSQGTVLSYAALSQLMGEADPDPPTWVATRSGTEDCVDGDPGGEAAKPFADALATEAKKSERDQRAALSLAPGAVALDRIALITMGSPLGQLHGAYFPNYFAPRRYHELRVAIGERWENFYRQTDYIGKQIFVSPQTDLDIHGFVNGTGRRPSRPDQSIPDPTVGDSALDYHSEYHEEESVRQQMSDYVGRFAGDA